MARKDKKRRKINIKQYGKSLFSRFFGFEEGIDITNEVEVLKRRNIVIKNIIFLSNVFYFALMLIVSIVSTSQTDKIFNWVVTAATFPLTFIINYFFSSLISKGSENDRDVLAKQQIAMYFAVGYLFLSAMLFYLKVHSVVGLETFAYILFYYVLAVISLYQNKKVLFNGSLALFAILTILHFFATHNSPAIFSQGLEAGKFIIVDYVLRTLIFIIYVTALYATVSIAQYMHSERVSELIKRKEVETDFQDISTDLFKVVLSTSKSFFNKRRAYQIYDVANRLGVVYGCSQSELERLKEFSLVHLRHQEIEEIAHAQQVGDFDGLREKTELASEISKRIQIAQKCEAIARGQEEKTLTPSFVEETNSAALPISSQIILLSDLYITMRSVETYKRPLSHAVVMRIFESEFTVFFADNLLQRFIAFHQEFSDIYDNFK